MELTLEKISEKTETLPLYGGDLPVVTTIFQSVADKLRHEHHILSSDEEKEQKLTSVLDSVIRVSSNLMNANQLPAWQDVGSARKAMYFNGLLEGIDEIAQLLAETINVEMRATKFTTNILSEIRVLRSRGIRQQRFPDFEPAKLAGDALLVMPADNLQDISSNGAVRTTFHVLNNVDRILPAFGSHRVNSKVMVLNSVEPSSKGLPAPFHFVLKHFVPSNVRDSICGVWHHSQHTWSTKECSVVAFNATHTECECDRLATFAVLTTEESVSVSQMTSEEQKGVILGGVVIGALLVFVVTVMLLKYVIGSRCSVAPGPKDAETSYPALTTGTLGSPAMSGISTITNQTTLAHTAHLAANNAKLCPGQGAFLRQAIADSALQQFSQKAQPQQPSGANTIYRTDRPHLVYYPRPESQHIYSEIVYNGQRHHGRFPSDMTTSSQATSYEGDAHRLLAQTPASSWGLSTEERPLVPLTSQNMNHYLTQAQQQQQQSLAITVKDGEQFVRINLEDPYGSYAQHQQSQQFVNRF